MILNNYRKAYATAGAKSSGFVKNRSYDAASFMADANADNTAKDFGNFASTNRPPHRAPRKRPANKSFGRFIEFEPKDKKTFLMIGAALVALLLLISIVVIIANSIERNIIAENNTYICYEKDGLYYIAQNGEIVGSGFENELTVVPALDKSFAYVIEDTPDGDVVYILEDEEIEQILQNPVNKVLALADYVPGVVYKTDSRGILEVRLYSQGDDERITKDSSADNFVVSPDASAVAYTVSAENKVDESKLYIWENGFSHSCEKNMIPVELTKGGKCIYAYGMIATDGVVSKVLSAVTFENNQPTTTKIAQNFDSITATNIEGDEIMFYIGSPEAGYITYIYDLDESEVHKVGAGICRPLVANETTVCLSTFKDSVAENIYKPQNSEAAVSATYYIGSRFDSVTVAQYNGKLNSDGDIFYFLNSENVLSYVDLDDSDMVATKIAEGVVAFEVTEKDNVYYIDEYDKGTDSGYLTFYNLSTGEPDRIHPDVTDIAFNKYSNILYFTAYDSSNSAKEEEVYYVFQTEEGSGSEGTEFDDTIISDIPTFTDHAQKRTFAYIENADTGLDLYYTSNGKTFKLVQSGCNEIK